MTDSEINEANALAMGSQIVSGSATMMAVGEQGKSTLSQKLEAAMIAAVEQAHAEGITDPDEIKARKKAALDATLNPPVETEAIDPNAG